MKNRAWKWTTVAALLLAITAAQGAVAEGEVAVGQTQAQPPVPVNGENVAFSVSASSCQITDLAVHDVPFFEAITLTGPCTFGRSEFEANEFIMKGSEATLFLHDVTNGFLRFEAENKGVMRFQVADDVAISGQSSDRRLVTDSYTARVFPTNTHHSLGWSDQGFMVSQARGNFLLQNPPPSTPQRDAVDKAVGARQVGGEISFFWEGAELEQQILAYEDVNIRTSKPNENTFRVILDGDLNKGSTFVANFPADLFRDSDVGVAFYGVDEDGIASPSAVTLADDLNDILQADDEGPEYWIVNDRDGTHVLVSVPNWSVHMFEVSGLAPELVPVIVYGLIGGSLFVAVAAVGMFSGRRRLD